MDVLDTATAPERRRFTPKVIAALATAVALVVGFVIVYLALGSGGDNSANGPSPSATAAAPSVQWSPPADPSADPSAKPSASQPNPSASAPQGDGPQGDGIVPGDGGSASAGPDSGGTGTEPADPDAFVLNGLVVRQADVPSSYGVGLITGGDKVAGQATLDLCDGTFPSESLRTARLQVMAASVTDGTFALSTEAVLYRDAAAVQQATREIANVASHCTGGGLATATLGPAPDKDWPTTPGVRRQAFSVQGDTATGQPQTVVYLTRGRVLMGLYFADGADPMAMSVEGKNTRGAIVELFAKRLAALPASVVNR